MLNKLTQTLAVACLLATACFVILWMRSLKRLDFILYEKVEGVIAVDSAGGLLTICNAYSAEDYFYPNDTAVFGFHAHSSKRHASNSETLFPWPQLYSDQKREIVSLPYWLPLTISVVAAGGLLIRRPFRFSLRTLAIAATAVVLTLGLGVAASRLPLG